MINKIELKTILVYCVILASMGTNSAFCDENIPLNTLVGVVSDSNNSNPIANVSISILGANSGTVLTGGVTDENGKFRIQHGSTKTIDMVFEYIGFEKKYIYGVELLSDNSGPGIIDLGRIILKSSVIDLDAVNVSGTSRIYQIGLEKNVYRVSQSLMLPGKTGADALRAIPSVDVDIDGVISLRGDKNVTILVDGFPSGMASGDRRSRTDIIPAAIIDHIEIIANPSVNYDPSGMGGIINIVTKKNSLKTSEVSSRISLGTYGNFDGFFLMNYNKDRWGLSFSGNGKRDHQRLSSHRDYEWEYPDLTILSQQDKTEWATSNTGTFNISGDYKISQDHSLNLGSNIIFFDGTSFDTISHLHPVEYQMTSKENRRGFTLDMRGRYSWSSASSGKQLRTHFSFSQSGEFEKDVNDRITNGVGVNDHSHIYKDDAFRNLALKTSYLIPYNKNIDLHVGAELSSRFMNRELEYLHIPFGFDHNELIQSLFFKSNYHRSSGYKLEGGLRIESLKTEGSLYEIKLLDSHEHQDTTNIFIDFIDTSIVSSPFIQSHLSLYPGARLWYYYSDITSINIGYSGRTNRPRNASINPFPVNMIDEYHVRVGNPMLRPEFIDIVEIGLARKQARLQMYGVVFLKRIQNMIQWHSVDIVPIESLQYEVISTENSGRGSSLGSQFQFFYGYNDYYSYNFSFNSWDTKTEGSDSPDLNGRSSGYLVNTSLTGLFQNNIKMEISGYHRGMMEIPTGSVDPSYFFDIGIEKRFPVKSFSISLTFKDVFDTQSYNITTNESMLNLTSQQRYNQRLAAQRWNNYRSVVISLDYAIGNNQRQNRFFKRSDDLDNDYNY